MKAQPTRVHTVGLALTLGLALAALIGLLVLAACGMPATAATTATSQPAQSNQVPATTAVMPTAMLAQSSELKPRVMFPLVSTPTLQNVAGNHLFTEGPAVSTNGNVFFSDINAGKIYQWSPDGTVSVYRAGLNRPNGLAFDVAGNLIVCEGGNGRLISIDANNAQGQIAVLTDLFDQKRYNEPNDLWIDPQGGIYFTDPAYQSPLVQSGEHVYYLSPDRSRVTRVISDMVRPNGIAGTPDGKTLYVADHGAGQTYAYAINSDATLADKRLFVSSGSDGMDLDASGNLYLTVPNWVRVFDAAGNAVRDIPTPENPTNVAFAGQAHRTLFITARTAVYTLQLPATSSSTRKP